MDCRAATMAAAPGVSSSSSLQCDYWPNMSITRAITNKWFSNPFTLPSHSALSSVQTNKGCTSHRKNKTKKVQKIQSRQDTNFSLLTPTLPPGAKQKSFSCSSFLPYFTLITSLRGSHGLSTQRARRTNSSWPEGPPTRS